jgi:uncharacterized glyoxalase superfamily protein PhnB
MITFEVESRTAVDRLSEKAVGLGAVVVRPPFETYYGWYQSVMRDPEGHAFRINRSG